jgi:hypothetical protein
MSWIRPAGLALALLLLMTSAVAADPTAQQLESSVSASPVTVGNIGEQPGTVSARPSFKSTVVPQAGERGADPVATALHRLESLTGGWRVNAGISPGAQVLGVSNGHVVSDHWMNFHVSVGLKLR